MARIVANCLSTAGIREVYAIGADQETSAALGLAHIADSYVGQGPLGALITAMQTTSAERLCLMPCDVPYISATSISELLETVARCDGAVLKSDKPHWLCSAWNVANTLDVLAKGFEDGERALHRGVSELDIHYVDAPAETLRNINTPSDIVERS